MITQKAKSTDNHCLLKNTLICLKRERKYSKKNFTTESKTKVFIN